MTQILDWRKVVAKYNFPDNKQSIWQLVNSIVPFLGIWVLMYYSLEWSYWITLGLSLLASGFMVRIFIIFHDCGHKSFFKSAKWNERVGFVTGLFSFTPYHKWHRSHNKHHATVGNLDKRGTGDVMTMTVEEFEIAPKRKKLFYKLYRHPLVMLGIGAPYLFIIQNRFYPKNGQKREKVNVILTNLTLLVLLTGLGFLIGFKELFLVEFPIIFFSSIAGTWLFYVQHQFEGVKWFRHEEWDFADIALNGSSFYQLPRIIQWFTGNIGFHHVHHLGSKIPNYKLQKCHQENAIFQTVKPVSFMDSMKSLKLRLWDEEAGKLIGFNQISSKDQ